MPPGAILPRRFFETRRSALFAKLTKDERRQFLHE
jgi:hypothetical protein